MQVSVESPSKLERRVTVVVPANKLDEAFETQIAKIAKTASVKGFRPGNVPLSRIKQMYGDTARQEALSALIQSSLYEAITQQNLNPVGMPTVEPKTIVPGQPLEFVAIFEVMPEISNVNFDVKALDKNVATITDTDVEKVVDRLLEQHVTWTEVDRAAKEKDQVVLDFRGSIDGKVFPGGESHNYPIIIGSKTMIPGFEEGCIGIKAGEEKVINVTFPADYFAKEVAGKVAEFTISAHKVSEPTFPKLDDNIIKQLGIKSGKAEELRGEIQKNLSRELDRVISSKQKNKIFDLLLEQNNVEVPAAMVKQEAERIHNEMHPHHGGKGHDHSDEEMSSFTEAAKRNVMLGLLVGEFVKQQKLTPDQKRVEAHIAKLASAYEKPSDVIEWYAADKRRVAEVEMLVLEEQVIEKLLENVTVTEKTLTYSDLIAS